MGNNLDGFRERLRGVGDETIAEMHADGPDGMATSEAWKILDEEFRCREESIPEAIEMVERRQEDSDLRGRVAAAQASFGIRLGASMVELGVLAALAMAGGLFSPQIGAIVWVWGWWLYFFIYFPICESQFSGTLAARYFGLRVVTLEMEVPSAFQIVARALLRPLGPAGLFWWAFWGTPWLHDLVTKTRVIRIPATPN